MQISEMKILSNFDPKLNFTVLFCYWNYEGYGSPKIILKRIFELFLKIIYSSIVH